MTPGQEIPADSVVAALQQVLASPEYDWSLTPDPLARLWDWYLGVIDWLAALQRTSPFIYTLLMSALTGILLVILAHFAYTAWRAVQSARASGTATPRGVAARDDTWHLAEARRHAAAGRYREALGHRFLALVLRLDGVGAVRFHPSKTPGEYAREARLGDPERGALASLVGYLYAHLFGGAACSAETWDRFDGEAGRLEAARATN